MLVGNLKNKSLLLRLDLNVPMDKQHITDDSRIQASLKTLQYILAQSPKKLIIISHLGQPSEGKKTELLSLEPVRISLEHHLKQKIPLLPSWPENAGNTQGIALAENVRFLKGETANAPALAKKMTENIDLVIMDAFAVAHRSHASTCGIIQHAKKACLGPLFQQEITNLSKIRNNSAQPSIAIIGGAKISTKLGLLKSLLHTVDALLIGGGMANTFLQAQGYDIASSFSEPKMLDEARQILTQAQSLGKTIVLPSDVVMAQELDTPPASFMLDTMPQGKILDIGPKTVVEMLQFIHTAKTIIWNGPMGYFEHPNFAKGTLDIAQGIARSTAYSAAGGGDTLAAIKQAKVSPKFSYLSTGGGAFLQYLESGSFPLLKIMEQFQHAMLSKN
jgi:phosphoglycerate kinase